MESSSISPIGRMRTCFKTKNGTPRQPSVSTNTRGQLTIDKSVFNNPEHSLEGLGEFSYVWVLFSFHLNHNKGVKAKVRPPRLDGAKLGVFATRSPHRPNPIGLTLAKLEKVDGSTVTLSGLDIVDGTPIIDIKPYIPQYDLPLNETENDGSLAEDNDSFDTTLVKPNYGVKQSGPDTSLSKSDSEEKNCTSQCKTSSWLENPLPDLDVRFTSRAENDLLSFSSRDGECKLEFLVDHHALRQSITDILKADPRSTYRRRKCSDRLYYFTIDNCHVTAWFDYSTAPTTVEVLRVKPEHMILSDNTKLEQET